MKSYIEYMDKIIVDEAMHERIMYRLANASKPNRRGIAVQYTAAAAVVLFICMFAVRNISHQSIINLPLESFVPAESIQVKITAQPSPTPAAPEREIVPLIFNKAEGSLDAARMYIPGYFIEQFDEDDLNRIFNNKLEVLRKSHTVSGMAGFSGEGKIIEAVVNCVNEANGLITVINMGIGYVTQGCYIYSGEQQISKVEGVETISGFYEFSDNTEYFSGFTMEQTAYHVSVSGSEAEEELTLLVNKIISCGAADLSKIEPDFIPEWREDKLTLDEAKADADFGEYVPSSVPARFRFESSHRFLNQNTNSLSVNYTDGNLGYINFKISWFNPEDKDRIVDVAKKEQYDLSLYPIPRGESVPPELRRIVDSPIFMEGDFTREILNARAYTISDTGDAPGYRMKFGILYGDVLIEISGKGIQKEELDFIR